MTCTGRIGTGTTSRQQGSSGSVRSGAHGFTLFFTYDLFKRIWSESAQRGVPASFSPGWLAVAYIGLLFSLRLPGPVGFVGFLSFLPLLPIVSAVNVLNRDRVPEEAMNRTLSAWNIVALVVGGLFFALALIGSFLPSS